MKSIILRLIILFFLFISTNIIILAQNLILNGDFSGGNVDFTSNYNFCNSYNCGYECHCGSIFSVGTDANYFNQNLYGFDRSGTGNFMMVDGAEGLDVTVWSQTVPVLAGRNYYFSFYLSSLYPFFTANIQVLINDEIVGSPFIAPGALYTWEHCLVPWNSTTNTSAIIKIIDLNREYSGNDFGLDDIYFGDIPTPVEMSAFTSLVNNNNVNLNWTTASETNNSGFDIERQDASGKTQNIWNKISFINGHGTTTSPNNYEFTDRNLASGKYTYRLKQIDFNGNYEYHNLSDEVVIGVPDKFELSQNYPNPFNPVTNLEFGISDLGFVSLKVYNSLGNEVATLVNEIKPEGRYEVTFDGSNLSSGIYFYKIEAGNFSAVKRMILLK